MIGLGAQFIIHLYDFRRGEEKIEFLPKTGWELREEEGFKAFFKCFSDPNKSNQENIEDENSFGLIPDVTMENGFNPANFMGNYLITLNPDNSRLFQRIKRPSKDFDIHDLTKICLFEKGARGKNKISKMLQILCGIVNKPGLGNHSIRATGIRLLKRAGFEDRIIRKFSSTYNRIFITNHYLSFNAGGFPITRKSL